MIFRLQKPVLLALFGVLFTQAFGQGIEFFHGTWQEGLQKAKEQDRIIFVDAFAKWCGPCKRMAATTFMDPTVGEFYNANFINMKLDMEEELGLEFRKLYPVSSFPTLFFIDADGEVVQKVVGARDPAGFIELGESVLAKYDKSTKYVEAYEAGDRSYELVYNYVAALNKAGKPSVKISNDYLSGQQNLSTPENLKFILEAATQVDCQCFDLLEKYKNEIAKLVPEEAIKNKIRIACANTVKRAIEYESEDLLHLASDAMKNHIPAEAEEFKSESKIQYSLVLHDLTEMQELITNHTKRFLKNDIQGQYELALQLEKYAHDNKDCMNMAVELAAKAAKDQEVKYVATYASLVQKTIGKEEAIRIIDEALKKYPDPESRDNRQLTLLKKKFQDG